MRVIVFLLVGFWALPFLAQNVPESTPVNQVPNHPLLLQRQQSAVEAYFSKRNKSLSHKKTPAMDDLVLLVPQAKEGFVIFKKKEDGTVETSLSSGKKALLYAKSYGKKKRSTAIKEIPASFKEDHSKAGETAPVQEAVDIIKSSIRLGKNLQSRYEQYKRGDRADRCKLIKELIFGSGKKQKEEEREAWHIRMFANDKTGMLEVYANVTDLEVFILDEEGNVLQKVGELNQVFTELDRANWAREGRWIQFVKGSRVRVMKL